jgi:PEP-CTERM putative exosortase interaction domain
VGRTGKLARGQLGTSARYTDNIPDRRVRRLLRTTSRGDHNSGCSARFSGHLAVASLGEFGRNSFGLGDCGGPLVERLLAAGKSPLFQSLPLGGGINLPPNLVGLQSFNIYYIPEPGTLALLGLGALGLMIFRRK